LLHLVGYLYYWQMGFNSVFKGLTLLPWKSSITYSECVSVASVIQHACTLFYFILWPVRLYGIFPHYLINGRIFGEKIFNIKCVLLFSLQRLSEILLILRPIQRDVITNVHWSSSKVPAILVT
jgi:hypothetical protein